MAEAPMYHGVALVGYVDGKPVDAFGNEVKGAPPQPKDTDPSMQPHVMAALNSEERSAAILAGALATALGKGPAQGATKVSSSKVEPEPASHVGAEAGSEAVAGSESGKPASKRSARRKKA